MSDPVAATDQAVEEVRQAARVIAALYHELVCLGIAEGDAHWFAREYAERMWDYAIMHDDE